VREVCGAAGDGRTAAGAVDDGRRGRAESVQRVSFPGDAKSSLGDAKSSRGVTLRARWVTLRARWVTLRALAG
jgi:hypothetical protein